MARFEPTLEVFLMMLNEDTNKKDTVKFKVGNKFVNLVDIRWDGDLILEFE